MKQSAIIFVAGAALALFACGDSESDSPSQPKLGAQLDRAGRAAVSTLIATFNADAAASTTAKQNYAKAAPAEWSGFADELKANIAIFDGLDENCTNQLFRGGADGMAKPYSSLASVLADDKLYVNAGSGVCGTYLGLEAEVTGAVAAGIGGCGGRTPTDDVVDRTYSVLATGGLSDFGDNVNADTATHSSTAFPFLAGPINK